MSKNRHHNLRPSFLRNHSDTIAIIGINLALGAMLLTMIISNMNRIDACNARSDYLHQALIEAIKDARK